MSDDHGIAVPSGDERNFAPGMVVQILSDGGMVEAVVVGVRDGFVGVRRMRWWRRVWRWLVARTRRR